MADSDNSYRSARAAARLRTSAAHARWKEIKLSEVRPVIEFTRELMAAHLECQVPLLPTFPGRVAA
jgi:hypothetical protein